MHDTHSGGDGKPVPSRGVPQSQSVKEAALRAVGMRAVLGDDKSLRDEAGGRDPGANGGRLPVAPECRPDDGARRQQDGRTDAGEQLQHSRPGHAGIHGRAVCLSWHWPYQGQPL